MIRRSFRRAVFKHFVCGAIAAVALSGAVHSAQAQDFFSALFGGLARGRAPAIILPFANDAPPIQIEQRSRVAGGGPQAFCVRTCDGRYFPISAADHQSRAESCHNFCPSSATRVVYGSSIDDASTEGGKPYSELPNAFRYRSELVPGCTCNGRSTVGLAQVKIENDPTLRKGDIVASTDGLMVMGRRADKRGAALNWSPASSSIRARYERVPVMAQD